MVDVNSVAHTFLLYIYDSLSLHFFSVVVKKLTRTTHSIFIMDNSSPY